MDAQALKVVNNSLDRCLTSPAFLDRFYEIFLASSPKVREKFARTNFTRQKRALQASLYAVLSFLESGAAEPDAYLREVADVHGHAHLGIGAELYDLWLDSLLAAVQEFDPQVSPEVLAAWEAAMQVGIHYFLSRYRLDA
jgi:hemoglobin-like flavoprotein